MPVRNIDGTKRKPRMPPNTMSKLLCSVSSALFTKNTEKITLLTMNIEMQIFMAVLSRFKFLLVLARIFDSLFFKN
jgi:hypothetical protein